MPQAKTDLFSESAALRSYLLLMAELATRIDLVAHAYNGNLALSPPFAREYSYLQFRRICELVALGCLQLHGNLDVARSKDAKREWHAEKIMKLLHRAHPHAFPQSAVLSKGDKDWEITANSNPEAITFGDFKVLYNKCGEVLHRGTTRSLEAEGPLDEAAYQEVIRWSNKLVALLNTHVIARSNGADLYLISLRTE